MVFGMTRGEIALVVFIFALIWGAQLLPRLGERVGAWLAGARGADAKGPERRGG